VGPLDFLHVEGHGGDLLLLVEVEQVVGVERRFGRQDGDDVEGDLLLAQQADAAQHAVEGALAPAGAAVAVVEEGRAVHADAGMDMVRGEEPAPAARRHARAG
jgi:hypothetical protein